MGMAVQFAPKVSYGYRRLGLLKLYASISQLGMPTLWSGINDCREQQALKSGEEGLCIGYGWLYQTKEFAWPQHEQDDSCRNLESGAQLGVLRSRPLHFQTPSPLRLIVAARTASL
jgi:hypothetical protein